MSTSIPTAAEKSQERRARGLPLPGRSRGPARPARSNLDDARSTDPVERLLEDSWDTRSRGASRRELLVEAAASVLFLCAAVPLGLSALASHRLDLGLAALLVGLYAIASRIVKFPLGAGFAVPSYVVLVPMLLLLPVGIVPLLTAAGLLLGTLAQVLGSHARAPRLLSAVPDAWHSLGPVAVLLFAGRSERGLTLAAVYIAALLAGFLLDLLSATIREALILRVAPNLQLRVIGLVWALDGCLAPLGLLAAHAARRAPAEMLLILPFYALLLLMSRDRNGWIASSQHRLDLLARERTRLQTAVGRLGEALAARLDLETLTNIVLRSSIEALDADAGHLTLGPSLGSTVIDTGGGKRLRGALRAAAATAQASGRDCQVESERAWALALPFVLAGDRLGEGGAIAVVRADRAFREDEKALMRGLVERAQKAAGDIVGHQALREQVLTDPLTRLGNRRKLAADVEIALSEISPERPMVLVLFDLNGFKSYNDSFGHQAGDAILERLGSKLAAAVADHGGAYRLGGDEFCVVLTVPPPELSVVLGAAAGALEEHGEKFSINASYGAVLLPHEASSLDYGLQLADQRMYANKRGRRSSAGTETRDVLMSLIHAVGPSLREHAEEVTRLCRMVGLRLAMSAEQLDELARAAELHDIGKVAIPDAIREKPQAGADVEFMHQHSVIGERVLSAAQALRPVAMLVRSSHERWDGRGHPDRLAGQEIPLGARIISVCDTYVSLRSDPPDGERLSEQQAADVLRMQSSSQFDPAVVAALLDGLAAGEAEAFDAAGDLLAAASDTAPPAAPAELVEEVAAYLRAALVRGAPSQPAP
jgi:diguanylate cyclase (GGDEF)-like protein